MDSADDTLRRQFGRRVLAYWLEHPDAKDNAEGIRLWWLGDTDGRWKTAVEQELEWLVERGWATVRGADDRRVYALNRSQTGAIEHYLAGSDNDDAS